MATASMWLQRMGVAVPPKPYVMRQPSNRVADWRFYKETVYIWSPKVGHYRHFSEEPKRVVFQKGGFGGCSPGTKTGTRARENRNEGMFACSPERRPDIRQNHPLQNRPFISR